jgi:hypothetical protein
MSNAVKDAMNVWGREFLSGEGYDVQEDAEITYKDDSFWTYGCETCSFEEYIVRVSDGFNTHTYNGSMSDLLYNMTREVRQ